MISAVYTHTLSVGHACDLGYVLASRRYAQLKLKASMTCDEMQLAQQPPLLDLDCERLQLAIKASEFKFGELPIAGLDDLDCNVPKAEIVAAKKRLVDAQKAQQRQAKARQQLTVRSRSSSPAAPRTAPRLLHCRALRPLLPRSSPATAALIVRERRTHSP